MGCIVISHWLISQTKGSHWSIIFDVTWPSLCQQVYHEKEQGRSLDLGHGSPARPEQDWEELRLQAVTSCHAPRRQAVSVLAASSCPDRVQLTTQYQASAAPLKASYLQSFRMTQFLEKSNVDSLYDIMPCWSQVSTPSSRRLAQWNVDILNVT